jgi:hypothetical protein
MDALWNYLPRISDMMIIRDQAWEKAPDDWQDANPSFRLIYDDEYLFLYAETNDDTLHCDKIEWFTHPSRGYNDDCFEAFLDGNYSRGNSNDEVDDTEIWFNYDADVVLYYTDESCGMEIGNIEWIPYIWKDEQGHKNGWSIEAAIPLADIPLPPAEGTMFGLDLKYSDDDGHESSSKNWMPGKDREHNIRWSDDVDKHPPSSWNRVMISNRIIHEFVDILKVDQAPTLNGKSDDVWTTAPRFSCGHYASWPDSYHDFSLDFQIVYTETALFICFHVLDDHTGSP